MERLDGSSGVPDRMRGGIVALGNFDGFHKGHQAVVGRAIERARAAGRPALVATFDPHPVRFFRPEAEPFRLTSLNQRQRLFAEAGADAMIVFPFNAALARLTAEEFVSQRLAGVGGVVTGEDFTFGKGRGGNVSVLGELGRKYGFIAEAVAPVSDSVDVISSSRIREALQAGDCATATQLLTRPFAVEGIVQHGDKNGRELGYPTANVDMGTYLRPRYGIYAVRGRLADGRILDGAANIGIRPNFDPPKELLEPHFFDFSGDLYGQTIEIAFHAFLRDEAKLENLEALTRQIGLDCDQARAVLAKL
ncbi:MAG: bifunctional riboflavin kinase/FAD synthetase [Sphingomonadales bacterium]|nr:bifunctional riboflavin kinase/FAD synthetase [Sphingomonadales bacterium]MBK6720827.1 bifunctional riboflavin kinase/FAD synthetase [Sphingomonadales bacterium]